MHSYNIEYLPVAVDDLNAIIDYILIDDPLNAVALYEKIDESIKRLSHFPELGVIPKDIYIARMNYLILIIDTYLVFYVFDSEIVEIRRILSSKRKYDYLF